MLKRALKLPRRKKRRSKCSEQQIERVVFAGGMFDSLLTGPALAAPGNPGCISIAYPPAYYIHGLVLLALFSGSFAARGQPFCDGASDGRANGRFFAVAAGFTERPVAPGICRNRPGRLGA